MYQLDYLSCRRKKTVSLFDLHRLFLDLAVFNLLYRASYFPFCGPTLFPNELDSDLVIGYRIRMPSCHGGVRRGQLFSTQPLGIFNHGLYDVESAAPPVALHHLADLAFRAGWVYGGNQHRHASMRFCALPVADTMKEAESLLRFMPNPHLIFCPGCQAMHNALYDDAVRIQ